MEVMRVVTLQFGLAGGGLPGRAREQVVWCTTPESQCSPAYTHLSLPGLPGFYSVVVGLGPGSHTTVQIAA